MHFSNRTSIADNHNNYHLSPIDVITPTNAILVKLTKKRSTNISEPTSLYVDTLQI